MSYVLKVIKDLLFNVTRGIRLQFISAATMYYLHYDFVMTIVTGLTGVSAAETGTQPVTVAPGVTGMRTA
jgi:hypothetical protein